jgi:DNA-binding CsgD family transcriptional regulator
MPKGFPRKKTRTLVPALGFRPDLLTPTQERRAASRLKGKTLREIAKAEGCSPSSVADSLKSAPVRELISAALRDMSIAKAEIKTNEWGAKEESVISREPLLQALLNELARIAMDAKRPGPNGMVPDNRTRLDAILKLLPYFDPGENESQQSFMATSQASAPGIMQTVTQRALIATERQTTTHA